MFKRVVQLLLVMVVVVALFGTIEFAALAKEAPVFIEEFDNGLDNWTVVAKGGKEWQIEDGILTGEGYIVTGEDTWEDYHVQALMNPGGRDAGIICRWLGPGMGVEYTFEMRFPFQMIAINLLHDGEPTLLVSKDYELEEGKLYEVEAVCKGDKLKMYVDGELELEVTDSELKTGKVGLHFYVGNFPGRPLQCEYFWVNNPRAVEPAGKITITWARIKSP